jgi:hypothetical protein
MGTHEVSIEILNLGAMTQQRVIESSAQFVGIAVIHNQMLHPILFS